MSCTKLLDDVGKAGEVVELGMASVLIISIISTAETSKNSRTQLRGLARPIAWRLLSISENMRGKWGEAPHRMKRHIDEFEVTLLEVLQLVNKCSTASLLQAFLDAVDREKEIVRLEKRLDEIQTSVLTVINFLNGVPVNPPEVRGLSVDSTRNAIQPFLGAPSQRNMELPGNQSTKSFVAKNLRLIHTVSQHILDRESLEDIVVSNQMFSPNAALCLDGRVVRNSLFPKGTGGYADVYDGIFQKRKVAIKVVRPFRFKRDKLLRRLWREYLAWSRLSHPNILPCLGYSYNFSPSTYTLPSLISPWMENGTIISYLETYPNANRLALLVGVADGLSYLHTSNPVIVHGDIRGGNILVSDQGVARLADFVLSRIVAEIKGLTTSSGLGGSLRWMSPELFHNEGNTSMQSDVWAFGMTVLEVMSGECPYSTVKNEAVAFGQIKEGQLPLRPRDPIVLKVLDDDVWDMCQRCWSFEPTDRPSRDELVHMMNRPVKMGPGWTAWSIPRNSPGRVVHVRQGRTIHPRSMYISGLCFSTDGYYLAIACSDNVVICNTSTGETRNLEPVGSDSCSVMRFSSDGEFLAIRDIKGNITVWDTLTLRKTMTFGGIGGDGGYGRTLEFSSAGLLLSLTERDWELRSCNMRTRGQNYRRLDLPFPNKWKILASRGTLIAMTLFDTDVYIWDTVPNSLTERLIHCDVVLGALFSPDGDELFSWSVNGLANLWDLRPFLQHRKRNRPLDNVLGYSPFAVPGERGEKSSICSASWEQSRESYPIRITGPGRMKWVVSRSHDGTVLFSDLDKEQSVMELRFEQGLYDASVDLSPTSGMIATVNAAQNSIRLIHYHCD